MRRKQESMENVAKEGRLKKMLDRYLAECRESRGEDPKKNPPKFPNLAGFCRWLGCGISELDALRLSFPELADYLVTVMEDEALNSPPLSPTLAGTYLKRRLGYAEKQDSPGGRTECGEVRLVFDHDIDEDGA